MKMTGLKKDTAENFWNLFTMRSQQNKFTIYFSRVKMCEFTIFLFPFFKLPNAFYFALNAIKIKFVMPQKIYF